MRRIISAILCVLFISLSFVSCGEPENREYDSATVIAAAKELIKKSEVLNEVLWGAGLNYVEDLNYSDGVYYMANPIDAARLELETIDDIYKAMSKTYSESYCDTIKETIFESMRGESSVISYARYYQKYEYDENNIPTAPDCIMVNSAFLITLTSEVDYMYDTLVDIGARGEVVYVRITVDVTRKSDGKTQRRDIEIGLIEEADGFRLHTPSFVNYYDESEFEN